MDGENRNQSAASKVLTSEQLQRLQELQRRRLQIQKSQNASIEKKKKKKKSKKTGKEGGSGQPEQASNFTEAPPASAAVTSLGQRLRVDVATHSFTPPKDSTVSVAVQEPEDDLQAGQESKGDTAHDESHSEIAVTQQALVVQQGGGSSATAARRKRKKLHWGLDSKERWERKSNM